MKKAFSFRKAIGLCAIVGVALAMPAWAKGHGGRNSQGGGTNCSGKSGKTYNVTSNILGLPTDVPPFQLLSDGNGPYVWIKYSSSDTVLSEINAGSCDWGISISPTSTERAVEVSLGQPVPNQSPAPTLPDPSAPDQYGFVSSPAGIGTSCAANSENGSTSVGNITGGQSIQCALSIKFISGGNLGTLYFLKMNPSSWSGTTWAQVDCTDSPGTPCTDWTITPGQFGYYQSPGETGTYASDGSTNQYPTAVGELYETCSTCVTVTPMGLYYVDFSIKITNP